MRGSAETKNGSLVLVATPIGNLGDISSRAISTLASVDLICCEDTRHSGQLFKQLGIGKKELLSLHRDNERDRLGVIVERWSKGQSIAIVSDAGMPLVSDPGFALVREAIDRGVPVSAIPGASAGVMALTLSGFSIDRWRFEGFLPRKGAEREKRLVAVAQSDEPSVIYEAPQRVQATLRDLLAACGGDRQVAISRELTKIFEEVVRLPLAKAVEHDSIVNARGEFVVVVDRAMEESDQSDDVLRTQLTALMAAGLSSHDAIKAVEALSGAPHRRAYQAALELKGTFAADDATSNAGQPG